MSCPPGADAIACLHARLAYADAHVAWAGDDWTTVTGPLPIELLRAHAAGEAVVAAYPAADGVARAGVIDVDLHAKAGGPPPSAEAVAANEAYAKRKSAELA